MIHGRLFIKMETLPLFNSDPSSTSRITANNDTLDPIWNEEGRELPDNIFIGTSTWAFPEWKGVVYHRTYRSAKQFSQESLAEYAQIPWFRTVCIDSLFYTPPTSSILARYADQVPDQFQWVSKVWERVTIYSFPEHARYGKFAGKINPDFLNFDLLSEKILAPYSDESIKRKTGPFVLQFAPFSPNVLNYTEFLGRLAAFLHRLPKDFMFAVEVRNKELLTPRYFDAINKNGVTHCFNQWNSMPPLRDQMVIAAKAGGLSADFYISRCLTPLGMNYEQAGKLLEPYTSVKKQDHQMRESICQIARRAMTNHKRAYITANNKAEGNAALTMAAIGKMIVADLGARSLKDS